MAATAAVLWGINGTVSKVILASGVSSLRLTEVRCAGRVRRARRGAGVRDPGRLRVPWRRIPFLAVFGICGLAFVQWFYFLAIHRVAIGIALLVQYLAPLLVALWARFVYHEPVRRRIWLALALALGGLALIVDLGSGGTISGAGISFALAAAVDLHALSPARRTGRGRPGRGLAARLGIRLRDALLLDHRALVELPRPPRRRRRLAARPPLELPPPGLGADDVDGHCWGRSCRSSCS